MTKNNKSAYSVLRTLLLWVVVMTISVPNFCQETSMKLRGASPVATTDSPSFDAVSIRPNISGRGLYLSFTSDGFTATNMPIQAVIVNAYNLRAPELLIGGKLLPGAPGWVNGDRYDIRAKVSASDFAALQKLGPEQQTDQKRLMLQSKLVDRFKLKVRRDARPTSCYALIVDKGGLKMKERGLPVPGMPDGKMLARPGSINGQGVPLSRLIFALTAPLDCPLQDKTGLTGNYDFDLRYSLDEGVVGSSYGKALGAPPAPPSVEDSTGPSLFAALREQLGLRLVPSSVSVPGIVIVHIERPSEN